MTGDELLLSDDELELLEPDELAEYEEILTAEMGGLGLDRGWRRKARPDQLPPAGEWEQLFYRGGRGSGKTWAASHVFAEQIDADPLRETEGPGQWAIVAPTFADVRDTCVESESGLLAALGTTAQEVAAGRSRTVELWNRSIGELRLRDGSRVFCDGADDGALRLQGRNLRGVWGDEISLWKRWETAWDESLAYALRKGDARLIATGTPKADQPARALVRRLLEDPARARPCPHRTSSTGSARNSFSEDCCIPRMQGVFGRNDWIATSSVAVGKSLLSLLGKPPPSRPTPGVGSRGNSTRLAVCAALAVADARIDRAVSEVTRTGRTCSGAVTTVGPGQDRRRSGRWRSRALEAARLRDGRSHARAPRRRTAGPAPKAATREFRPDRTVASSPSDEGDP